MSSPSSAELLSRLIAFDTTSRNSNLPLIEFVEGFLADHGVASRRVGDETGEKANLWATIGPEDRPGIILSGHTDTVPVDGQDWTSDPFRLEEREGRLYGRGTCDMKGFLACALAAVPKMVGRDLDRPIHLAFSYDEEVGCLGVIRLLDWMKGEAIRPEFCIVGEPTLMQVVTGHKAKRAMEVRVRGRPRHSSLAPQGVNAIDYAAMVVLKMRELAVRLATSGARDEAYDVPHTTAHTGIISGGTVLNIVPESCVVRCEFRALPNEDVDALVEELRDYGRHLEKEMQTQAPEAGIEIEVYASLPGLETPVDSEVTRLAKTLARTNGHAKVAYGTEGGRFADMLQIPTVICGPGSINQAHRADEFIAAEQLTRCDAFLERLIAWARNDRGRHTLKVAV